jgi:hypothetical protein
VQISTGGRGSYVAAIKLWFHHRAGHGSEVKDYGQLDDTTTERKNSPMSSSA